MALLLTVPACGTAAPGDDPPPTEAGGGPSDSSDPVADPEHAVDPPGPLTERLLTADMLVFSKGEIGESVIHRLRRVKGIVAVEPLGLAQVTVENRAFNVAAVRPASYRRFTPQGSAQLQEAWERVAGGEVAVTPALGKRLQDDEGRLSMGGGVDAPDIHIGAFAPQVPQVDAVVNTAWGEELGMSLGNAVLISTGELRAPLSVRKPVQRIVGGGASVQLLDAVARYGLDTSVQQTAFLTGSSIADVVGTFNYTVLGGGRIAPEPAWVASHIGTRVMPIIGPMTCNVAIFDQLEAALREVVARGLADELHPDEYAGCYYPRFIAGSTTLSNHSFGLAMDFNTPGNQRGTVGEMDRTVVSIFKKWGFAWGGDWGYTDPMHFELSQVVEVR